MGLLQNKSNENYTIEEISQYLEHPKLIQLFQKSGKDRIDLNDVEKVHEWGNNIGNSFYESQLYALLTTDNKIDIEWNTRSWSDKMSDATENSRLTNMQERRSRFHGQDKHEKNEHGRLSIIQNHVNVEYIIKLEQILKDLVWKRRVAHFKTQIVNIFKLKF